MKKIIITFLSIFIYLISLSQHSKSTLVLFNNPNLGVLNFITIISIEEKNNRVLFGNFNYIIGTKNDFKNIKLQKFDSLESLKILLDTAHYDTFNYEKGKIFLKKKKYVYYSKSKKIKKLSYIELERAFIPEKYENEFYCEYKNITRYFYDIPFDLYDFKFNRFRKIDNKKKSNWIIMKGLYKYQNLGFRYQFLNYILPFFSPYSFYDELDKHHYYCYIIGNFYESYKYLEKVFNGQI